MPDEEVAILGGGCFWCIEAAFADVRGVREAVSGYCGGHVVNPTYEAVCGKQTGHIEVVKLQFDPSLLRYDDLLAMFFTLHDPTSVDRQGNDAGPQYRSAIFCQTASQRATAEAAIQRENASGNWPRPLVTEVRDADVFYPAEHYHQDYFRLNGSQPYCAYVVAPKIAKFRKNFAAFLR